MGIIYNRDAQFMLLAGFIIAVGLVITTVVLNSVIFEGNMAVETGNELSKNEMVNLMQITKDEIRNAYRNATDPGQDQSKKIANFTSQSQNFATNLTKLYAFQGAGVNISWDVGNWNNSIYANFTDNGLATGTTNWTVIEGVRNVSKFELRDVSGMNFEINVTNQTTGAFLWSMRLNGSDNITIMKTGGYVGNFSVNYAYIDLLNSTYNFGINVATDVSKIQFLNGRNASGRFIITGNTSYGRDFTRARDHILNGTISFSTSRVHANITIPVSVPW